ncbi:hypothetical protein [Polaribacter sp. SA4-12]|uniref:hypothetical protein n=1 Tax=Polaribacter sp. SA4-12 TaxID=1312072 RepID=UPI000B3C1668|nr:hypothetical protein [Polaribacter sp. SA4-12]ARV14580.1 hypothetical protein BTO07_05180 [Polaribacter sp. SA4-12]
MIKVLITDFFYEIEKKELKKNKNAQATFWVEELQEVTSIDKNYISVKKATRLYNKYVEEREQVIVKEPNKYLLDFMSLYLGYKDFEDYQTKKEPTKEIIKKGVNIITKNNEKQSFLKEHKKRVVIGSSLVTFLLLFFIIKNNTNNSETCIVWKETHFEESTCRIKHAIDNSLYKIDLKNFKKIKITKETAFFKNGKPQIWYGKSSKRKMDYFTQRGIHPETLKELDPITEYIINKYVFTEEGDKTIVN